MRLLVVVVAISLLLTHPASSQASRAINLPDTLGANFSIADSATAVGSPSDYDFLLGAWHFRFQSRRSNGTHNPPFTGHWTFNKPGPALIEDNFRPDDPSASPTSGTHTYRAFMPQKKMWQMLGVTTTGGEWALGLTWSDATNRYAIQRYGSAIMRIRYFAIEDDRFLWRADRSTDNGRTWTPDWWTMEATRISR